MGKNIIAVAEFERDGDIAMLNVLKQFPKHETPYMSCPVVRMRTFVFHRGSGLRSNARTVAA